MIRWKSRLYLLVALAMTVALAACAAAPAGEGLDQGDVADDTAAAVEDTSTAETSDRARTLIMDIDGGRAVDPELWNPFVPGSRTDLGYQQTLLEPLFVLNYQNGEFIPWLGETFEPNESLDVWTLTLRDGVMWSDGEAFNADDVVFTINMLKDNAPEMGGFSGAMDRWVGSVAKVDDLTVEFTLNEPNPRFLLDYFGVKIYNSVYIMPEHIWAGQDPLTFTYYDTEQGWPIGTGPYTLEGVSPTEFTYERDDDWWGVAAGFKELPAPETIIWTWGGPEETRAALMADGQLDSLMDVTLGALLALQEQNPNVITWFDDLPYAWVPDPCSRTLELNLTQAPWDDPEMRWGLNYAIDRDQIVAISYEGSTLKSRHFFPAYPPLDALVDTAIEAGVWDLDQLWDFNPERAAEIFESKGYEMNSNGYYELDGEELTIDMATHEAFIEKQRIAQVLVEQFQAAGINATTHNEAGATWTDNFELGNFESKLGWQTCGSVNEPWGSLDTFNTSWLKPVGERTSSSQNAWRWSGEDADEYSALVDQIGSLPLGDPQIEELFLQATEIWFANLPAIPITQAKKIIPFDTTYWTGWPTAENDYIHPPTWWQHTHVIIHELEPTGAQ